MPRRRGTQKQNIWLTSGLFPSESQVLPQCGGREGEVLYSTIDAVRYRDTGLVDNAINAIEGQGDLVITGVQEKEGGGGVAGVHLNGVATRIDDRHVQFEDKVYSQCLSQMSQTQRIIDH